MHSLASVMYSDVAEMEWCDQVGQNRVTGAEVARGLVTAILEDWA